MKKIAVISRFSRHSSLRCLPEVLDPVSMRCGQILFTSSHKDPAAHVGQCKRFARENEITILPSK